MFRKLLIVWGLLDFCLFAAGVLAIVASVVFNMEGDLILDMFFMEFDLKIGIVMGGMYISAVALSIPAILQNIGNTMLLKALTWWLLALSIATLVFGTIIWDFSLQQLQNFSDIWVTQTPTVQQAIQDKFSCCGYWNGTAAGQFTTAQGFCSDTTFAANQTGCQPTITSANAPGSDHDLEIIFSTIYGFEAIIAGLFLATLCVINERRLEVRFARIDEKRGGGGFV